MKPVIVIETKALVDGTVVFRSFCPKCNCRGAWLKELATVDRNAEIHARTMHAETADA